METTEISVFVFLCIAEVLCQVESEGPCPYVPLKPAEDIVLADLFDGITYYQQFAIETPFTEGVTCLSTSYTYNAKGDPELTFTGRGRKNGIVQPPVQSSGFCLANNFCKLFFMPAGIPAGQIKVIDYYQHSFRNRQDVSTIFYSCQEKQEAGKKMHDEYLYVSSTIRQLASRPNLRRRLESRLRRAKLGHLIRDLKRADQSNCQ